MKHLKLDSVLSSLVSGDYNKKECINAIKTIFSEFHELHGSLKEGDDVVLYKDNISYVGIFIKKGDSKSLIRYKNGNKNRSYDEVEIYNCDFFKMPKDWFE